MDPENSPALEALRTQVSAATSTEQQKSLSERARERGTEKREKATEWLTSIANKVDIAIGVLTDSDLRNEAVDMLAGEVDKAVDEAVGAVVEVGNNVVNKGREIVTGAENKVKEMGRSARDKAVELYKGSVNGVARVVAAPIYEGVKKSINGIEIGAEKFVMSVGEGIVGQAGEFAFKGGTKVVEATLANPILEVKSMSMALAERGSSNFVDRAMGRILGRVSEVRSKAFEVADFGSRLRFAAAEIRNAKGSFEAASRNKGRTIETNADRMRAGVV